VQNDGEQIHSKRGISSQRAELGLPALPAEFTVIKRCWIDEPAVTSRVAIEENLAVFRQGPDLRPRQVGNRECRIRQQRGQGSIENARRLPAVEGLLSNSIHLTR